MRAVFLLLAAALTLYSETFKLYLKDGSYQVTREYQVESDRIRYFSTERGEWEEIPKDLIDLEKTERERKAKNDVLVKEARAQDEEDRALRAQQKEIAAIPMNPGAYYKQEQKVAALPSADYQIITDKKRKALQVLSPVPLVPGKASVVIKGEHSAFQVREERPDFYVRLAKEERFGVVSLTSKKNFRVVENISIAPVVNVAYEDRKLIETFEQDLGNGLFKVWPEKPLPPGEYALVEFSDSQDKEDIELSIWDFARPPGA